MNHVTFAGNTAPLAFSVAYVGLLDPTPGGNHVVFIIEDATPTSYDDWIQVGV